MAADSKKSNLDSSFFLIDYYCKLKIKGIEFLPQNVEYIHIKESAFDLIPWLEMTFIDDGLFFEKFPLEDGDEISIELATSNEANSPITCDFIIQDFTLRNRDGDNLHLVNYNLTAILKNKEMFFPIKTRCFKNKSSVTALSEIASETGFNPDVRVSTSDSMKWLQVEQTNYEMIYDLMRMGFKSNDVLLTAITRKKSFIITSLGIETKKKSSKKAIYDPAQALANVEPDKKDILYFNNFSFINLSGIINKKIGYGVSFSSYDLDKVTYKKITSDNHPLTEFSYKNKNNIGKIVRNDDDFIINNLNVHKNFAEAIVQNEFLFKDFFKNCLILYANPNDSINIFEKISVTFPSFEGEDGTNQSLSGEYIVTGIVHQASKAGNYRMIISLFRNGINGSPYMKNSEYKVS